MKNVLSLLVIGMFVISACSTHVAHLKYSEFKDEMPIKAGAWNGTNVGFVKGEEGGAIWGECTEKARGSIRELIRQAQEKGGNAVGDIRWTASGNDTPTCKKGWGYLVITPFILTPLFMSTQVTGNAYKVTGKAAANMLMLPTNSEEEVAFIDAVMAMM